MINIFIGIVIGGALVTIISYKLKNQTEKKITQLQTKNKELLGENYTLKTENAQHKVFVNTIKDRVVMLEERGNQMDTWFGSLLRHNPQQPFSPETIERLIAENKIDGFDDT